MAELKLCPFCGRMPMVEDCGDNRFFVRCKCGIAQDKLYGQRCDAVRRWNTRKPSTDTVEVEQLATNLQPTCNQVATDCISRQAALNTVQNMYDRCDTGSMQDYHDLLMETFEILPSADAVEIVRCRDCKHKPVDTWFECPIANLPYKEDRWCWKGERKDG